MQTFKQRYKLSLKVHGTNCHSKVSKLFHAKTNFSTVIVNYNKKGFNRFVSSSIFCNDIFLQTISTQEAKRLCICRDLRYRYQHHDTQHIYIRHNDIRHNDGNVGTFPFQRWLLSGKASSRQGLYFMLVY
jgi:hypothetical protein